MSHLDLTGCKKRRRGERVFRFKSFGEHGSPGEFPGAFRENVKALIEFGHLETNLCGTGMHCWSFQLEVHRHPPVHVLLFVIEELMAVTANNRHCEHCQFVGWGHHMICNKKYHFLMPSKDTMVTSCGKESGDPVGVGAESYCRSNILVQSQGHVMHGVFHSNGFGHLLCINGLESGSDLTGHTILQFWDRLCTGLRVRKVSLKDTSQKCGMDLRLLHGVAYGQPWFGRWGYKFARGTYCITYQNYQKALHALRALPLSLLPPTCHLLSKYHSLSDHALTTLGDLFHFLLELRSRLPNDTSCVTSYNPGILVETTCRWSPKRIEMATRVIVEALKRARLRRVSRQEVRDAARNFIGDTGLLDFVLKSLGNQVVGNYLVRRSLNPVTKVLEYCLEDVNSDGDNNNLTVLNGSRVRAQCRITRLQLMKDVFYLYKHVLRENTAVPLAVQMVLDAKYLVKEYSAEIPSKSEAGPEGKFILYCTILLKNTYNDDNTHNPMVQPYECVTVGQYATIDEVRREVETSFKEIYLSLRGLTVESIHNVRCYGTVNSTVEAGQRLVFEGSVKCEEPHDGLSESIASVLMDCPCGAREDDGERRVCCDICETWQHTRCVGIPSRDEVPHIFLCGRCEREIILLPNSLP